eukprot:1628172-Prymnesium_polylepis.1
MKSCPKCRKSGPGSGTRTRHTTHVVSRKWLDLAGQGLDRTSTAAAIHGGSPREGHKRRQMVYWEQYGTVIHAHTSRRPAHKTHVRARTHTVHSR